MSANLNIFGEEGAKVSCDEIGVIWIQSDGKTASLTLTPEQCDRLVLCAIKAGTIARAQAREAL